MNFRYLMRDIFANIKTGGFLILLGTSAPGQASKTMNLACYYYDTSDSSANASILHAGLPWLWAQGSQKETIAVRGEQRDGFFEISEIMGQQRGLFGLRTVQSYENSQASAKALCASTLKNTFPATYEQKAILGMSVKTSFLSINKITPVFRDQIENTKETRINKMVIFGDSLSDTGNLKTWLRIIPRSPYFGGRFSNGRNWVDYLQEQMGVSVQNLAIGGSVTHPDMEIERYDSGLSEWTKHLAYSIFSGSVDNEIRRYREEKLSGGQVSDPTGTLHAILIGGNDYLALLNSRRDVDTFIDNPDDSELGSNIINARVVKNIDNHLLALADIGARNLLVINLPDFGIIPKLLNTLNYHYDKDETFEARVVTLSRRLSEITQNHNRLLKAAVENFEKKFPHINVVYTDIYTGLRNAVFARHIFKPGQFFNYELDQKFLKTLAHGNEKVTINKACYGRKLCPAPDRALFWDNVHPTTYAHCLLALGIHKDLYRKGLAMKTNMRDYLKICRPEIFTW